METTATTAPQEGDSGKKNNNNNNKKVMHRRVAPSKAPARMLKKQIRSLERLLANKSGDVSRTLPDEKIAETKATILALQKQLQALPPPGTNTGPSKDTNDKKKRKATAGEAAAGKGQEDGEPSVRGTKGLKARELRRAGRKIVAFKKQHPNYEDNEEEAKAMADLELDLLYIKHFPRNEPYISIYPNEPHEDDRQIAQAEIRQKIADAVEKGEIRHGKRPGKQEEQENVLAHDPDNPVSNWSDDGDEDEEDEEEEAESEDQEDDDSEEEEDDEEEEEQQKHKNKKPRTK